MREPPRSIDGLAVRRRLGVGSFGPPLPFGPDGWRYDSRPGTTTRSITVSACDWDGVEWVHASIAGPSLPSYAELCALHRAVWPRGHAYQCFVPPDEHVNIHPHALHLLHLWGRLDGARVLPDFGAAGTI